MANTRYYYYNPNTGQYDTSILCAVHDELKRLHGLHNYHLIWLFGAEEWGHLTDSNWVKSHPEEACEYLGFYRLRTKCRIEYAVVKWIHNRLLSAAAIETMR